MTGFGRGQATAPGYGISAEVRSVNGRQRDVRLKLPVELSHREARLRELVSRWVARGRVEVFVGLDRAEGRPARLRVNRTLARSLVEEARRLQEELDLAGSLDLGALLSTQGMVEITPALDGDDEVLAEGVEGALDRALAAHARSRESEGARLLEDLRARFVAMADRRAAMSERAPEEVARITDRLRRRVEDLVGDASVDEARLAQEVAYLAERSDISEELVRLESHLAEAGRVLGSSSEEPVGRRLEFLLQEILREANTIASKSGDLEIGRDALEIKVEVEKAREQVQNVE